MMIQPWRRTTDSNNSVNNSSNLSVLYFYLMISIELYRQRVGSFNFNKAMSKQSVCKCYEPSYRKCNRIKVLLLLLLILQTNIESMCIGNSGGNNYMDRQTYQNKNFLSEVWNKEMRSYNGNTKKNITIGHWNGGPSYLGNSLRGKDKLEAIRIILEDHKIDILGVSEANIDTNIDQSQILIQGYNMAKSEGNIARICVFYKSNLNVKI